MLRRKIFLGFALAGLLTLFGSMLMAQSNETIITIAIDEWQIDMLSERVLQGFYDTHPGVKIVPVTVSGDESFYGFDNSDMEDTLDKAEAYFRRADVLVAREYNLNPLITNAGFVLDLTPYIRADGSGAVDDFYPVSLKTFEWDDGLWAIPASLRLNFITYDPKAFDNAGYPHPDSSWRLQDYLDAGRALTERDAEGKVTLPGFYGYDERLLVRALLGHGFYDDSTQPETPTLNDPEIESMLESLDAYNKELNGDDPENSNMVMGPGGWESIPLQMGSPWTITEGMGREPFLPVLFENDSAIVSGEGFAISAGTQNPDLAYELIMYLTSNVEVVTRFYGDAPARSSMEGQTDETVGIMPTSDALKELLPTILENGIPSSEARYGEYIYTARNKMAEDEAMTLNEALNLAQEQAVADLELATSRQAEPIVVSTPVPTPVLASGEIAIKFSLQTNYSPVPNRERWDALAQEFADTDPEVGFVEFVTGYRDPSELLKDVDCAYTSYNYVPWIDLSLIQPLDPFLSTDSTFDLNEIPDLIWPTVTREEMIYGLPMTLTPLMMWYDPNVLEAAGAFTPQNGWTVSDFIDTLEILKDANPDETPYVSQNYGNSPYVLMAAALGGVAVDYTTYVPTYHLTDPAVVEALRQTLDLAKNEYMSYTELDTDQNVFMAGGGGGGGGTGPALYDAPAYIYNWDEIGTESNPHLPVTFPQGSDIIPLSYNVGAAYITSQTPYPDACYRWLSVVGQHLDLFNEMPARRSQASSDAMIASQGQTASDVYVGLFEQFNSPNAAFIPVGVGGVDTSAGAFIADIWFNKALDAYVLEDGDLDAALSEAQTRIDEYTECISGFPPYDESLGYEDGQYEEYFEQFTDCATSIDPSLASRFTPPGEDEDS